LPFKDLFHLSRHIVAIPSHRVHLLQVMVYGNTYSFNAHCWLALGSVLIPVFSVQPS
jgi:hypothetical protein